MPSIITEGFLSKNPALITEGYAVLDELAYTSTGTITISGLAFAEGPIFFQRIYDGSGLIDVSGKAELSYTFNYLHQGKGSIYVSGQAQIIIPVSEAYTGSGKIDLSSLSSSIYTKNFIFGANGEILVSGLADYSISFLFTPSGFIELSGLAQTIQKYEYIYSPYGTIIIDGFGTYQFGDILIVYLSGGEILVSGKASTKTTETIVGRIVHPAELPTFTDRLITPSSYDKVSGKRTGVKIGTGNYPDLYIEQQIAAALKGKRTKYTGTPVYFSKKTKGKTTHLEGDKTNYFDWISEKKKR